MMPPEMVTAIFYNFAPERVAKALPAAWQIAGPEAALQAPAGFRGRGAAPLRHPDTTENVIVAAELAGKAARCGAAGRANAVRCESGAGVAGRSAGRAVGMPRRCCASTRGDTRTAVLERGWGFGPEMRRVACRGRERSHATPWPSPTITTTPSGGVQRQLAARGLLGDDGSLTAAGRELMDPVDSTTDALSLRRSIRSPTTRWRRCPVAHTDHAGRVVGGDLAAMTPITLRRDV